MVVLEKTSDSVGTTETGHFNCSARLTHHNFWLSTDSGVMLKPVSPPAYSEHKNPTTEEKTLTLDNTPDYHTSVVG